MNTIGQLIENGIGEYTAEAMLSDYSKRIGTMNGVYKIKDINYDFKERGKDITLQCTECGRVIHRIMVSGRNKWSELIKSCPCQKRKIRDRKKAELENSKKIKKAAFEEKLDSYIGMIFGDYIVRTRIGENRFIIECVICGNKSDISYKALENNTESAKHCTKHYIKTVKYDESYIGKKKNFLKIIEITKDKKGHKSFLCECDCGNIVNVNTCHWEKEKVKSCGCMHDKLTSLASKKHGYSGTRIYSVWRSIIDRCENPKNINYDNYGGRGIVICQEWKNPECFIKWAFESGYDIDAPFGECTIDRIDVNGNYEPSNCRWTTIAEQNKNKRPSSEWKKRKGEHEYKGKMYRLSELCGMFGTSEQVVNYRMKVVGMSLIEALEMPKMTIGRPRKQVSSGR